MRMRGLPLPSYEGDKPFVYACFASEDSRRVRPYLRELMDRRFRLHYTGEARTSGARAQRMASRMRDANLVLLFFSERANRTALWRYQVNFATDCKKRIVCVRLDDSEPSKGMRLQFAGLDFFDAFRDRSAEAFFTAFTKMTGVTQALLGDNVEGYPKETARVSHLQRAWPYVAGTVLLATAALAIVLPPRIRMLQEAQQSGGPQIEYLAETRFSEPLVQRAVEETLGKTDADTIFEDDLLTITELSICGGSVTQATYDVKYAVSGNTLLVYINGYSVVSGDIADVRELTMLPELQTLRLSAQKITDLSPLEGLPKVTVLDLGGNPIADLSPLANLQSLVSLDISCTAATGFSALRSLPALKTLYIRNMPAALDVAVQLPLASLTASDMALSGKLTDIADMATLTALDISRTDVESIEALTRLPKLETLHLTNCAALTDWEPLTRMPALKRVYMHGTAVISLPEEVFRALVDRGVEIVL